MINNLILVPQPSSRRTGHIQQHMNQPCLPSLRHCTSLVNCHRYFYLPPTHPCILAYPTVYGVQTTESLRV